VNSLIIGASAGLGRALSTELAAKGHDVYLVASDERDLDPLACDLRLRFDIKASYFALDLNDFDVNELRENVIRSLGMPNNLFYVAGYSSPKDTGQIEDVLATQLMNVNMVAAVRIVNAFLHVLENSENSNIVGIGSTAAARPRRHNSIYGSAKRGFEFYFGTLRHYLAYYPCSVQFYRMGYLDTRMTFQMKLMLPKLNPEIAARKIISGLGKDMPLGYIPSWWRWVMLVYKLIPQAIHNCLDK